VNKAPSRRKHGQSESRSPREIDKPIPAAWADKHIVANVQKYMTGKFVLCKGNGSSEIAELK